MSGMNEQLEFGGDLQPTSKNPNYVAYSVAERKDNQKPFWTRIGVGFLHQDGGGLNLLLDCLPIDGRITLRSAPQAEDRN